MEEDEDYVETSDIEELAELENDPIFSGNPRSRDASSPRRASSPLNGEDFPRKRAKLFHQLEDPYSGGSHAQTVESVPGKPLSSAASALVPLYSPIQTPRSLQVESLPKLNITEYRTSPAKKASSSSLPELSSQEDDPLLLHSPRHSQMPPSSQIGKEMDKLESDLDIQDYDGEQEAGFSPDGSPFPEAQIPTDMMTDEEEPMLLDDEYDKVQDTSDTDGHITEDPSTTPPITQHSPQRSPWRSPRSSPDPLALKSQSSRASSPTRASSVDTHQSHSDRSRQPSLQLDASPRTPNSLERDAQPDNAQKTGIDELLLFSPTKLAPEVEEHFTPTSPLSEGGSSSTSPHRLALSRSPSPRELIQLPPPMTRPAFVVPEDAHQDEADVRTGKYTLRLRKPAQKNPYKVDRLLYAAQMKDNPEAYVGLREIRRELEEANARGAADTYEDDEAMEVLISRVERELEKKKQKRRELEREKMLAKERAAQYPGILQEDVTTDEEEREMNEALKKAKKILKTKEKEKKEREKEARRNKKQEEEEEAERKRKAKGKEKAKPRRLEPYPGDKPTSKAQGSSKPSVGPPSSYAMPTPSRSVSPPFPSFRPAREVNRNSHRDRNSPDDVDIFQDYFNEVDIDMYGPDDGARIDYNDNEPGPSNYASRARSSTSTPRRGTLPALPAHSPVTEPEGVIELSGSDKDEDEDVTQDSTHNESFVLQDIALDKRSNKALSRMLPKSLIKKMANAVGKTPPKKVDRRPSSSMDVQSEDEDDGSLRPGQTRARRLATAVVRDVKGDTESESESGSSSEDSGSDTGSEAVEILRSYKRPPRPAAPKAELDHKYDFHQDAISIASSDSEGDDDIRYFVQDAPPVRKKAKGGSTRPEQETLIDYMLQRDRASGIGGRRKSKKNKTRRSASVRQSRDTSGYKYDIMTRDSRGHGRERQTLLSFSGHATKKLRHRTSSQSREPIQPSGSGSSRPSMARSASKSSNGPLFEHGYQRRLAEHDDPGSQSHQIDDTKHLSWKEQQKRRKKRAKKNGLYTISHGGAGGVGWDEGVDRNGIRRTTAGYMTVDLEDETFHHILASGRILNIGAMRFEPPDEANSMRKLKRVQSKSSSSGVAEWANGVEPLRRSPVVSQVMKPPTKPHGFRYDLGIRPLSSGRSFSTNSYIRKGWLHDLLSCSSPTVENAEPPPSTTFCRLGFSVGMGTHQLCQVLPRLLDALHEAATDLLEPEPESLSEEWKPCMRITSQIITWHIQNAGEEERTALKTSIEGDVLRCAKELEKHTTKHVEKPVLSLSWFLVELSVRCSRFLPGASSSNVLQTSCRNLMQFLFRLDISRTTNLLKNEDVLDPSLPSPFLYATELWVCLMHVLLGAQGENSPTLKSHPFWTLVIATLQAMPPENDPGKVFEFSEDMWLIIFTLCALSQFSSNGIATTKSRLPASWAMVEVALKKISLLETPEQRNSNLEILKTRDRYVRILILRCTHLRDTWQWRMDESSPMFNTLAQVFRTRDFTILRHEEANGESRFTPKFFQKTDWSLLDKHDSTDTTFAMFLKLVYHACHDEMNGGRKSQPRIKKLLSLTIPLRPLSFTKPPGPKEVSPFFNCLSAIAVAVGVDNSDQDDRVNRARGYFPYATADPKSRHRILVGIQRLAVLMIKKSFNLSAILDWFEDIIKTVAKELKMFNNYKSFEGLEQQASVRQASHICSCASEMIKAFTDLSLYPDPQIIARLKAFWEPVVFREAVLRKPLAILLKRLFAGRTACLPLPPRPFRPTPQQADAEEESQDYFAGFQDIDLTNVTSNDPQELAQARAVEQDETLRQILQSGSAFMWQIYPHVKAYVQTPPSLDGRSKEYIDDCDLWMRIWLNVGDVARSKEAKWKSHVELAYEFLPKEAGDPSRWAIRVKLSIMFQLLQIAPMAYQDQKHFALEVFFTSIGSDSVAIESQYTSLLLSIDCLHHPTFAGFSDCLPPRDGDYQLSAEQFKQLKLPLLRIVFANLEQSLTSGEQPPPSANTGTTKPTDIDHCASMFSWMRESRTALENKFGRESDRVRTYTNFCFEVQAALRVHPTLRAHTSFIFFVTWSIPVY